METLDWSPVVTMIAVIIAYFVGRIEGRSEGFDVGFRKGHDKGRTSINEFSRGVIEEQKNMIAKLRTENAERSGYK